MRTVTLLSQKGGSGKSTLAISLAVCAAQHDKNALLIDIDPQGTAVAWSERRQHSDTPVVLHIQARSLPQVLNDARRNNADWVFIDTAGRHSTELLEAVRLADIILIPCRPSILDLDAIAASIHEVERAQKQPYVVLNCVSPNATRQAEDLTKAIQENYRVSVFPIWVSQRAAFAHAALEGKSAAEWNPEDKAAREVNQLFGTIQSLTRGNTSLISPITTP